MGGLHVIGITKEEADRVKSQLSVLQRSEISNPPSHGARIVRPFPLLCFTPRPLFLCKYALFSPPQSGGAKPEGLCPKAFDVFSGTRSHTNGVEHGPRPVGLPGLYSYWGNCSKIDGFEYFSIVALHGRRRGLL